MEFSKVLTDLQVQANCPICLEYLKSQVTINSSGYNSCLSCIKLSLHLPCSFCHFCCPKRKFSSKLQLGNLTEIAKPLPIRRSKRKRTTCGVPLLDRTGCRVISVGACL
uniref:Uncharacterized protein n=1 Tax=Castor canadensis TaxID=51338 RepID=A0A8C0WAJ9_CASCN